MKFSLIMATLGRDKEIALFFDSLIAQTYTNYELIIIDQNEDDRVEKIYTEYKERINIHYHKNQLKGLSLNRNLGLKYASGDIIAFPDDDCTYDTDTLEKALSFFNNRDDYSFYTCNAIDRNNNKTIFRSKKSDADISIFNFLNVGISFSIFIRASALRSFKFDEQLGVGAKYGSGEESDLILFLIKHKNKGRYHANSYVYHPAKKDTLEKASLYGKGFGAIHKKAIIEYGFFLLFPIFLLRLLRGIINIIIRGDKNIRCASLCGRITGFLQYSKIKGPEK